MILQIVGFKNSGKTTLMAHTIKMLKSHQLTVATIKHHGQHQNEVAEKDITLQADDVDHMKHFNAGADQSIVQGESFQQTVTRKENQSLDKIISESVTINTNIILIEGFKLASYDKVVVYKDEQELQFLRNLSNVKYCINMNGMSALTAYDQWLERYFNIKGMH
ncbi:molybdopterin-guanine dinucleotide biosynthesis protein B [Staphylococcus caeli]|uniref:molybdopterin-guanine dinucleotide biosynthesis protein B n=1 Tax=Staphylococcus caeli TaxID=2201815 RepID=UPI003F56295B